MSYDEYKELVREYWETDSIKRRDEIFDKLYDVSVTLCEHTEKIYNTYGQAFVKDDDYSMDRGGYSLERFDEDKAHLVYSDHWSYGGECCIGISVPMKYLDVDERMKLKDELKAKRVAALKSAYQSNLDRIECIKTENLSILEKLAKLKIA